MGMSASKEEFAIGDLVTLRPECYDGGRLAIIVERPGSWSDGCKIQFTDIEGLAQPPLSALITNLVKITG